MVFVFHFLQAHIFSLGATLKAAVDYVVELEIDSDFSQDLHTLLEQMQEEAPKGRLTIEVRNYSAFSAMESFHFILTGSDILT